MLQLLIIDINYTEGVNRDSTVIKIGFWQRKGVEVTFLCTEEAEKYYKIKLSKVNYIRIAHTHRIKSFYDIPLQYIKANISAIKLLGKLKGRYDIVYSLSSAIDFIFIPWVLTFIDKKVRWFVVVDNIVPKPSERPGKYILKLMPYTAFLVGNLLLKRTDGVFVVTNFLKHYYEKRKMHVVKTGTGYGIDISIFSGKIRKSTPHFDVLYCGRIHVAKGIFDFLEVAKEVTKKRKKITFGIMGDGDSYTKNLLYDKISEYQIQDNIVLTGYKSGKEKGDIYRNCGLFLFLSYDEGCPQVVIEALAANKVVITYDLPVYQDVFAKYIKTGQLHTFKKGSIKKIANFITEFDPGKVTIHNLLQDYTWDGIANKEHESFYGVIR